jgi:hypothetical protein
LLTRCNRYYPYNRWDPEKTFKFSHRIRDENDRRAAYSMYSAATRAGDAPRRCEFGPGTLGLKIGTMTTEARGELMKSFGCCAETFSLIAPPPGQRGIPHPSPLPQGEGASNLSERDELCGISVVVKPQVFICPGAGMRPEKMPVLARVIALAKPEVGANARSKPQERDERSQSGRRLPRRATNYGILCCGANRCRIRA